MTDRLGRLRLVTLEAARVNAALPILGALRSWLDSWRGIGDVERGMARQGSTTFTSGPKPSYPRDIAALSSKALPWSTTLTSSARVDHVRLPRFAGVAAVAPLKRHKTRVRRPPAATRRVGALAGQ